MLKNRSGQVAAACWDNAPAAQIKSIVRKDGIDCRCNHHVGGGGTNTPSLTK